MVAQAPSECQKTQTSDWGVGWNCGMFGVSLLKDSELVQDQDSVSIVLRCAHRCQAASAP